MIPILSRPGGRSGVTTLMKRTPARLVALLGCLLASASAVLPVSPVEASRTDKANALSDCVAEADVIVLGLVIEKRDDAEGGVIRVRVLREPLKGTLDATEVTIADPSFRSTYGGSPEGPVVVEAKEAYVFFLGAPAGETYRLFNSHDGVIPPSGPVVREVERLVRPGADAPAPATQASRTVGTVYGKPVTAADIGLAGPIDRPVEFDARDRKRWDLMGRIMSAFGHPVTVRFVEQRKIEATAEEIEAFQQNARLRRARRLRDAKEGLARVREQLAAADLPGADRAKLEDRRASLEKQVARAGDRADGEAPEEMARAFITGWKIERELHRTYGGRVIFQQGGPEALDARRLLYEQAEKDGDLKFADPGVRHLFYYYLTREYRDIGAESLEKPWFFEDVR